MSWVDMPPCKMIPTLNNINAAITERRRYNHPDSSGVDPIMLPRSRSLSSMSIFTDSIRSSLRQMYREHFPLANLGKWAKLRPYGEYSTDEIDLAIAGELSAAGIDPAGFFHPRPHRICDGNFVKACYHLLNNVLIYSLGPHSRAEDYFGMEMKTERVTLDGVHIVTHDGSDGLMYGYAVLSDGRDFASKHIDRRYVIDESEYPKLRNSWKIRYYITLIVRELLYPKNSSDQPQSFSVRDVGTYEINFSGCKSDIIPWHPLTIENISTYISRDNERYGYACAYQNSIITEVFITQENLPPHNYQYLD